MTPPGRPSTLHPGGSALRVARLAPRSQSYKPIRLRLRSSPIYVWEAWAWLGALTTPERLPSGAHTKSRAARLASPARAACTAVGYRGVEQREGLLGAHWNGRKWRFEAMPTKPGAYRSGVSALTCPTIKTCFAVGETLLPSSASSAIWRWGQ